MSTVILFIIFILIISMFELIQFLLMKKYTVKTGIESIMIVFLSFISIYLIVFNFVINEYLIITTYLLLLALLVLFITYYMCYKEKKDLKRILFKAGTYIIFSWLLLVGNLFMLNSTFHTNLPLQIILLMFVNGGSVYFYWFVVRRMPNNAAVYSFVILTLLGGSMYFYNGDIEYIEFKVIQKVSTEEAYNGLPKNLNYIYLGYGDYIYGIHTFGDGCSEFEYNILTEEKTESVTSCINNTGFEIYNDTLYFYTLGTLWTVENTVFTLVYQYDELDYSDFVSSLLFLSDDGELIFYDGYGTFFEVDGNSILDTDYFNEEIVGARANDYQTLNLDLIESHGSQSTTINGTLYPLGLSLYDYSSREEDYYYNENLIITDTGYFKDGIFYKNNMKKYPSGGGSYLERVDELVYHEDILYAVFDDYNTDTYRFIDVESGTTKAIIAADDLVFKYIRNYDEYIIINKHGSGVGTTNQFVGFKGTYMYTNLISLVQDEYVTTLIYSMLFSGVLVAIIESFKKQT